MEELLERLKNSAKEKIKQVAEESGGAMIVEWYDITYTLEEFGESVLIPGIDAKEALNLMSKAQIKYNMIGEEITESVIKSSMMRKSWLRSQVNFFTHGQCSG